MRSSLFPYVGYVVIATRLANKMWKELIRQSAWSLPYVQHYKCFNSKVLKNTWSVQNASVEALMSEPEVEDQENIFSLWNSKIMVQHPLFAKIFVPLSQCTFIHMINALRFTSHDTLGVGFIFLFVLMISFCIVFSFN